MKSVLSSKMAAVQTTIAFKSRKLRFKNAGLEFKSNDENKNMTNVDGIKSRKFLKRSVPTDNGNESCSSEELSPKKISRTNQAVHGEPLLNASDGELLQPLLGREEETAELRGFLEEHLQRGEAGSLYVSGAPGTGKTACLNYVLRLPEFKDGYKIVYVNCTMMKSASSIYQRICTELKLQTSSSTEKACLAAIEKYLSKIHRMTLLVLDEIDQLESKKQCVLYTIFEWAARAAGRLVLVGVANSLDLTERALPRLRARGLRPRLLHFAPYTRDQIVRVLTSTLTAGLLTPEALQMLASKVAAVSGDMRRALDTGRRVAELARRSGGGGAVELRKVIAALGDVYGASQRLAVDVDDGSFPLQQKLLICSLMLMLTKGKSKDILVGKLYDVYKRVASARNIAAVDAAEFFSLCSLVETRGMIHVWGRREPRTRHVALQWDQDEVEAALRDKTLLSSIMNDVACLGR